MDSATFNKHILRCDYVFRRGNNDIIVIMKNRVIPPGPCSTSIHKGLLSVAGRAMEVKYDDGKLKPVCFIIPRGNMAATVC